jgi:hypothetical protein
MSVVSGILNSNATNNAADAQANAAANANATQQEQFNITQNNTKPWLTSGTAAVNTLSAGLQPGGQFSTTPTFNFDSSKVATDPGFAFRMQQGVNALTAQGAAAGNLGSGNMGTALVNYGQAAGSQEYQSAYQRAYQQQLDSYNSLRTGQDTVFNRLSGVAGTGQVASSQLATAGSNYASNVGNNLMTSAANQGNLRVAGANAIGQGVGGVVNQLMGGLQAYNYTNQQNQAMQNQWASSGGFYDPSIGTGYTADQIGMANGPPSSAMMYE